MVKIGISFSINKFLLIYIYYISFSANETLVRLERISGSTFVFKAFIKPNFFI